MIRCAYFDGSKTLKNDRKPLFTVLWNLRIKSTQFLGNFNNKPKSRHPKYGSTFATATYCRNTEYYHSIIAATAYPIQDPGTQKYSILLDALSPKLPFFLHKKLFPYIFVPIFISYTSFFFLAVEKISYSLPMVLKSTWDWHWIWLRLWIWNQ